MGAWPLHSDGCAVRQEARARHEVTMQRTLADFGVFIVSAPCRMKNIAKELVLVKPSDRIRLASPHEAC